MIGVGIIGAGYIAGIHARALALAGGFTLVAACAPDADRVAAFAARHGGRATTDRHDLLADTAVQAVLIATPHHLHEAVAIDAARAGKHILLEKPMAPDVGACTRIAAAAATHRIVLLPGHTMRFFQPCLVAKRMIEAGEIGAPVLGTSTMMKIWMQGNRRPWHLQESSGGGMLMTAGIHALDRLVWLMGAPAVRVSATLRAAFHDQQADDLALLFLRFADGAAGSVASVGYRDGATSFAAEIVGTKATLRLDLLGDAGVAIGRGGRWSPVPDSAEPDAQLKAITREWIALRDAITQGVAPVVTAADARHVVAVIEAARCSSRLREEVEVET